MEGFRRLVAVFFIALALGCATSRPEPVAFAESRAESDSSHFHKRAPRTDAKPTPQPASDPIRAGKPSGWPTEETYRNVSSAFGPRRRASGGPGKLHRGIDILAAKGSEVFATAAGTVIFSGTQRGYGKLVGIAHEEGYETWYAHLDRRLVNVGARIEKGGLIGYIGRTGNATAYHVHYEVRKDGKALDPRPFLH